MNPGTQQNSWLTETFYDIPNLFRRFNADRNKGNYEIHCLEFSYNMISGNIKMANMRMIMKLIGITQMPNIMFLIQLDDYSETYRPNPDFSSYPCKVSIVQNLQTYLERKSIQGVVARFIGFDSIALYLYAEGKALSEAEARGRVGALA
jgi:hypothetical protein